jgi:DMSO/TMAO reductase YedYZ heme-binding membrane subunit
VLIITLSFSMKKLIGQKWWRLLHYTSYGTFALVSIHAVLAGTDASRISLLVLIGAFSVIMAVLIFLRVSQSIRSAANKKASP